MPFIVGRNTRRIDRVQLQRSSIVARLLPATDVQKGVGRRQQEGEAHQQVGSVRHGLFISSNRRKEASVEGKLGYRRLDGGF